MSLICMATQISKEEFVRRIKEMKLPSLRFSITRDCNASCAFCHNENQGIRCRGSEAKKKESYLSEKQISYIANFFSSEFKEVKFTGGEPTLVTNFDKIIKIFSDKGYECSLTTNGFLLDKKLQLKLREAGITKVNVSLPTLDPKQHAQFFRVENYLKTVIKNLKSMPEIFKEVKINFMGSKDNVPSQLEAMNELSGELGIIVSCLEFATENTLENPISSKIINYLKENIGIKAISEEQGNFSKKKIYEFKNGGKWKVDDFRDSDHRKKAFNNSYCRKCKLKKVCTEAPYALRIGYDGTLRTCLIR